MATQQQRMPPPSSSSSSAATTTNGDLDGCAASSSYNAAPANLITYVQADPTTFRAVVQKLTGAPEDSPNKLPVTLPARSSANRTPDPTAVMAVGPPRKALPPAAACCPKRQKLHERRCAPAKLEIKLGTSAARYYRPPHHHHNQLCGTGEVVLLSPVSTMDSFLLLSSPSPTTPADSSSGPLSSELEEEKAIAEKGFYLHPSPRGDGQPPKLLPLFPLQSPRHS